jgi:Flp pilus assembly pilin Flp
MRQWWMDRVGQAALETWRSSGLSRILTAQSTVEYALVGALVVIAAATALTLLGEQVNAVFGNITTTLQGAAKP